ncbi:hypothetical protein E2C01_052554 [Portunus trituberculatus]|uniref:Uncharacterized protein n=1 Tax=Portunus trituberculatus TaxID=210409 RepID=A0A5B7GNJ4_PORTR|nr:hypothetical protein [Portunus trituberculatus]
MALGQALWSKDLSDIIDTAISRGSGVESPSTDFIGATAYRSHVTRDPQSYCDDCLVPLTVRDILVECPSLTDLRHRYLYRCRGRDSGVYYTLKVLRPECLAQGHDFFAAPNDLLMLRRQKVKIHPSILVGGTPSLIVGVLSSLCSFTRDYAR